MYVDWRKTLRSRWRVYPRTHCDLITAVSNQIPLILSLKIIFIKCISACLSTSNCIVKIMFVSSYSQGVEYWIKSDPYVKIQFN